ncbi:TetR family transcriptional regulator [Planctomonas sp. JC2975]|uniref:TetR family transcriptional regulator n=1 Tax=Planctomonas sp. JC2975 TaxID=2729626 RepID=UPI00197CA9B5
MDATRRERKKQQTRANIVAAAVRLFDEQGYDKTTVAQIAAAADVDPKTFFNYFPSKDEVLFNELDLDVDVLLDAIGRSDAGETPGEALVRAVREYARHVRASAPRREAIETSAMARLSLTTPALRTKTVYLLLDLQQRIADRLLDAFPDDLDAVTAAAITGSVIGSIQQVTLTGARLGLAQDGLWDAAERALEVAARGVSV